MLIAVAVGCGGDGARRTTAEQPDVGSARSVGAASLNAETARDGRLCDRIEDDEVLIPGGAEALQNPGVEAANTERRCMRAFGVDMPIGELRGLYRSTLADLGYEVTDYTEGKGIMRGNLSRTSIRASRSGLRAVVQIDEFDPAETPMASHTANVELQIDATGD